MKLAFHTLDVFTRHRFGGNPLAVILEADGLSSQDMQSIAREFNLSETVFVLEPHDLVNTARMRIFTPVTELPFAGHPIVGTAVLIGQLRARDMIRSQDVGIVLETASGPITCSVRHARNQPARARFEMLQAPMPAGEPAASHHLSQALGLPPEAIGFGNHAPTVYSAGLQLTFVPVRDAAALRAISPQSPYWQEAFGSTQVQAAFAYTKMPENSPDGFAARMFFPAPDLREDPATGSAAAAFAGVIMQFEPRGDGAHHITIEQGVDMGRASQIFLGLEVENGELTGASIAGEVIEVMQGMIEV
ncbi:MAG: PhzF family phenazine biosynthesis protein [Hyphomicrobiales bacterium]|nr:PhzF family phenazine biosynthesis protein [Hyphomicrobiales bacterium]MDE2115672.1 PhzF family phenazine biosynthesis protein [Hyphomicrobiales bacterium]